MASHREDGTAGPMMASFRHEEGKSRKAVNKREPAEGSVGSSLMSPLLWIVLFAFAARASLRWYSGEANFWVNGYGFFFGVAQNIAAGNGIAIEGGPPTAFRVPMYPAFLAAVTLGHKNFFPVLISESLIGAGTVYCAALIARQMFGEAAAITAATLTAIYPYYVVHDTALQDTSLYTFLTALAVVLLMRARRSGSGITATHAGLALGAVVLTRATLAPFALFAPIWLAFIRESGTGAWRQRLRGALLCASAAALLVSPWLIRSYVLTGSPALSTEAGLLLWVGNNPYTFSHYPHESIDLSKSTALEALTPQERVEIKAIGHNEAAVDQWFGKKGLEYIGEYPRQTFVNAFRKNAAAFGLLPSPRKSLCPNIVHALSYGLVMTFGLFGMWASRQHWPEHLLFYALFVSFVLVTAIFYGHTSHRAYLDVYWIVFAAAVLQRLRVRSYRYLSRQAPQPPSPPNPRQRRS
jgi:4-amino-4-deoxy-L-arabinose transferase-like glycosyltransferase